MRSSTCSAGRHACFDRLVLEFTGLIRRLFGGLRRPGVDAASQMAMSLGVRGGARLEIIVGNPASRFEPETRSRSSRSKAGAPSVRWSIPAHSKDKASSASARVRLPFRAFVLPGPLDGTSLGGRRAPLVTAASCA